MVDKASFLGRRCPIITTVLVEPEPPKKTFALRQSKVGSGTLVSFWLDILFSGRVVTVHTVGSLEPTYTRLNFNTELASSWWYENFAWRCPLQLLFNHFKVLSSNFSQDIWPISNPKNVSASAPKIAWSVFCSFRPTGDPRSIFLDKKKLGNLGYHPPRIPSLQKTNVYSTGMSCRYLVTGL